MLIIYMKYVTFFQKSTNHLSPSKTILAPIPHPQPPILGSPTGERDLLCRLDESSLPRAGTCCQKCLSCWKYILASLAAVSGNPQNQTEKSCSRSSFLEHLRRLIIRLSGECVRFRRILRISPYCCLAQRPVFPTGQVFFTDRPGLR